MRLPRSIKALFFAALLLLTPFSVSRSQSTTINAVSNQSNESQKKPREANEYDQNAMMGMYFAVMCELSSANGHSVV